MTAANGRSVTADQIMARVNAPAVLHAMHTDHDDAWDLPVPLGTPATPPPFPVDVFPKWLADTIGSLAEFTQTDPAMGGAVALSVLAACTGGRLDIEPRPGRREPTNLFVAVVAEPGERKTPVHTALTAPLMAAEKTLQERAAPDIAQQAALRDIAVRAAEQAKQAAAKADKSRREELTASALADALAAEQTEVPAPPRLFADDATSEALKSLMIANGGRMALLSDEGGVFDMLAGRYSTAPDLDPYLKGHVGAPMRADRKSRDPEYTASTALTVGVMIQPTVLRKFGGNQEFAGRGLVARFLFVLPASRAGWRNVDPDPMPDGVADHYHRTIHDLAVSLADNNAPATLAMTPAARKVRNEYAAEIETQLRPGGPLRDMTDWANKLDGATIRLAGLLHIAHHTVDAARRPVDADRMRDAVRLSRVLVAHYRAATQTIAADASLEPVQYVLRFLVDKQITHFTRRELHRRTHRRLPTAADVAGVIDALSQLGWIRASPAGGYDLHPDAHHLADLADGPDAAEPTGQPLDNRPNPDR